MQSCFRSAWRLVALTVCISAAFLLVSCKHGPDASTPKKASVIFAKAAQAGDMDAMRQVAAGTDAEFALAGDLGRMTRAFGDFANSASTRFGTAGDTRDMSLDLSSIFEDADETIDGDTATLTPKAGDEFEPMHLKKEGGGWKLDLTFLDKDQTAAEKSQKMAAMANVWENAAKEIDAGKFDTFPQAKAAVKSRLGRASLSEADARIVAAHDDLASLEAALDLYKADAAEFPSTADGLPALTQKPPTALNWHGPYLKNPILADPWGHPYVYVAPGAHNTNAYDLHSLGPDGKDGTADDIDNWNADGK